MTTRLGLRGAALMLLAGGALAAAPEALAVRAGEPAPAFTLATSRGDAIDLAGLRGRVVYVDFWASWCTPCRRSFPWMNALHARYGSEGLAIVGINVDKRRADADRFLADVPAAFAIVFDPAGATPAAWTASLVASISRPRPAASAFAIILRRCKNAARTTV